MAEDSASLALAGLRLFFALLLAALASSPDDPPHRLFGASRGRSHRLAGAAHLGWLLFGAVHLVHPPASTADGDGREWACKCLAYDVILGLLGVAATLTAARDFPHKKIANRPGESGTLSNQAMVTQGEMLEHAFYQGLNLWQALYLHAITWMGGAFVSGMLTAKVDGSDEWINYPAGTNFEVKANSGFVRTTVVGRMMMLWAVTLPWAARGWFPVHRFSANWTNKTDATRQKNAKESVLVGTERGEKSLGSVNRMYQVKKWQYIFYKHVVLHGLNISMAVPRESYDNSPTLPITSEWRVFWLALNTSYVMEFFLQSLVKRGIISQRFMMALNMLLMASASAAAAGAVLGTVRFDAAIISLLLNFSNRGHDIVNTMATGCIVACIR